MACEKHCDMTISAKVTILLVLAAAIVPTYELNLEKSLRMKLLKNYDPKVRPVRESSKTLFVNISMVLTQVMAVELVKQQLHSNIWLEHAWKDEFLSWNISEFPLREISLNIQEIWKPDFTIFNLLKATPFPEYPNVVVSSNGVVKYVPSINVETRCPMDVELFPFDKQTCAIGLGCWSYSSDEVSINPSSSSILVLENGSNSEWNLVEAGTELTKNTWHNNFTYDYILFSLDLQHIPSSANWNIILPCIAILLISIAGIFLPADCGERVSFNISALLAFTVFLLMVPDILPPSRGSIPIMARFLGISVMLMSLNTIVSIIVTRFQHYCENDLPPGVFVRCFLLNGFGKITWLVERDLYSQLRSAREKIVVTPTTDTEGDDQSSREVNVSTVSLSAIKKIWKYEWLVILAACDWLWFFVMTFSCLINIIVFYSN